jgi:hypothetical protein
VARNGQSRRTLDEKAPRPREQAIRLAQLADAKLVAVGHRALRSADNSGQRGYLPPLEKSIQQDAVYVLRVRVVRVGTQKFRISQRALSQIQTKEVGSRFSIILKPARTRDVDPLRLVHQE